MERALWRVRENFDEPLRLMARFGVSQRVFEVKSGEEKDEAARRELT